MAKFSGKMDAIWWATRSSEKIAYGVGEENSGPMGRSRPGLARSNLSLYHTFGRLSIGKIDKNSQILTRKFVNNAEIAENNFSYFNKKYFILSKFFLLSSLLFHSLVLQ